MGVRSPSRILCLQLQEKGKPTLPTKNDNSRSISAVAEAFLKYSPRVSYRTVSARSGGETHWLFLDIASTAHLFANRGDRKKQQSHQSGEEVLMLSAIKLAQDLGFGVQCAVADTPAGAQAFATSSASSDGPLIIPPGEERDRLHSLSLPHILHLEGLEVWPRPMLMQNIITFFMMLGFRTLGDLSRFTMNSLQERWGQAGETLWRRLNAQDRQVISPLLPTEPLQDYQYFDFPVSLVSLILRQAEKSIDFLFARLQGRRFFAQQLVLILHCEYSSAQHKIVIEPNTPSRDRDLFLTLLEERLDNIGRHLENPIREIELQVVPSPEKARQMDFFEPRITDSDKVQTLISLLTQSSLKTGLYRIEPAVLPEDGWRLASSPEERDRKSEVSLEPRQFVIGERHKDYHGQGLAIAPQPFYSSDMMRAPRPTRILKNPLPLSIEELERLTFLSNSPIERIESAWWENGGNKRDYFFAVSPAGDCLWIFRDSRREEYFLHGYFD
jgi:hypothetical protein